MAQNVRVRYDVDQADLRATLATLQRIDNELVRIDHTANSISFRAPAGSINAMQQRVHLLEQALKAAATAAQRMQISRELTAEVNRLNAALGRTPAATQQATNGFGMLKNGISSLVPAISAAFAVREIVQFGTHAVQLAGQMEQVTVAMSTMLGSNRKANALIAQTIELAAKTPFEFPELAQTVKQLLSFGVAEGKVMEVTKRLGDVAAGTGGDIKGLAFVLGQINTTGKANTQDLYQLANRGVPIFAELAKVMGVNVSEVRKFVEAGSVGFAEVEKAITNMTSEGGKFFGMMEAQSQTFEGRLSTFNDSWNSLVRTLGNELLPVAKDVLTWLTEILDTTPKYSEALREEQSEVNVLAGAYINALQSLDGTAQSKENLNYWTKQLNKEYPELLANLGDEATDVDAVRDSLARLNKEYETRITLAASEDFIAEASKKAQDAQTKQFEAQERFIKAIKGFNEEQREAGKALVDTNKPLAVQLQQMINLSSASAELKKEANAAFHSIGQFGDSWMDLLNILGPVGAIFGDIGGSIFSADTNFANAMASLNNYKEGANELSKAQEELAQRVAITSQMTQGLGLTQEHADELMKQGTAGRMAALQAEIELQQSRLDAAIANNELSETEQKAAQKKLDAAKAAFIAAGSMADYRKQIQELEKQVSQATDSGTIKKLEEQIDGLNLKINALRRGTLDNISLDSIATINPEPLAKSADEIGRVADGTNRIGKDSQVIAATGETVFTQIDAYAQMAKAIGDASSALGVLSDFYSAFSDLVDTRRSAQEAEEIAALQADKERFIDNAKDKDEARLQSEKTFDQQIKAIEIQQAKRRKRIALGEAIIQTALNVLKGLGTPPVPNLLAAGIAAGLGAVQIATIASTPGYKKGGYTGDKGASEPAGIVHGREFVFDAPTTKMNREAFEWIHRNRINVGDLLKGFAAPQLIPVGSRKMEKGIHRLVELTERNQRQSRRERMAHNNRSARG